MHSIKTAVVVSILLVVGYAVYTTLNNERTGGTASPSAEDWPGPARADPSRRPNEVAANPFRQNDRGAIPPRGFTDTRPSWDTAGAARTGAGGRPADPAIPDVATDPSSAKAGPFSEPRGTDATTASKPDRAAADGRLSDAMGATARTQAGVGPKFRDMMDAAQRDIEKGSLKSVLQQLTPLYGSPSFSAEESRQLTELLGQLAGEVIYSRKHYLHEPHVVQTGDSLQQIAEQCRVPWQLLANINGVRDPDRLTPGSKLKLVRGPFDAVVLLDRYELVLQIEGLYAGRFPIGIGRDQPRLEGGYLVKKKMTQPTYYGPSGALKAEDPDNPLGRFWIGLDERIGIHGTNDIRNLRRGDSRGCICLGDRDIKDVYDILSAETPSCPGSKVTIRASVEPPPAVAERGAGLLDRR
jgi:LysM repeat protein